MPRWDPDKELRPYEPISVPGTQFVRVLMDVSLARKEGVRLPKDYNRDSVVLWSLAI